MSEVACAQLLPCLYAPQLGPVTWDQPPWGTTVGKDGGKQRGGRVTDTGVSMAKGDSVK